MDEKIVLAEGVYARIPETGDESKTMEFFNALVDEDMMLANNQKKTIDEEARWLFDKLIQLSEGTAVFYFAIEEATGRIVGGAEAHLGKMRESHVATIGISVSEDFRRKGIGKRLLELVLSKAKTALGARIATLKVFSTNGPA
ncbi:MAG: GNAT family N-acetyltransferase, partial [archaeon]